MEEQRSARRWTQHISLRYDGHGAAKESPHFGAVSSCSLIHDLLFWSHLSPLSARELDERMIASSLCHFWMQRHMDVHEVVLPSDPIDLGANKAQRGKANSCQLPQQTTPIIFYAQHKRPYRLVFSGWTPHYNRGWLSRCLRKACSTQDYSLCADFHPETRLDYIVSQSSGTESACEWRRTYLVEPRALSLHYA